MTDHDDPFFLFIGHSDTDGAISNLRTSNIRYRKKLLESRSENWLRIDEILRDANLLGAVVKLTTTACKLMLQDEYADAAMHVFRSLGRVPHIIFIHEAILSDSLETAESLDAGSDVNDAADDPLLDDEEDDELSDVRRAFPSPHYHYPRPSPEMRVKLRQLISDYNLTVSSYKFNAERSVLAARFVEQHDKRLLFRVYVAVRTDLGCRG
jgi:hypothetical protein